MNLSNNSHDKSNLTLKDKLLWSFIELIPLFIFAIIILVSSHFLGYDLFGNAKKTWDLEEHVKNILIEEHVISTWTTSREYLLWENEIVHDILSWNNINLFWYKDRAIFYDTSSTPFPIINIQEWNIENAMLVIEIDFNNEYKEKYWRLIEWVTLEGKPAPGYGYALNFVIGWPYNGWYLDTIRKSNWEVKNYIDEWLNGFYKGNHIKWWRLFFVDLNSQIVANREWNIWYRKVNFLEDYTSKNKNLILVPYLSDYEWTLIKSMKIHYIWDKWIFKNVK